MAKPYLDGKGWAVRMRIKGQDIYLSGFSSEAAARKAAAEKRQTLASIGKPVGLGPWRTSLGQALQDYGLERLPFMKGAQHDANRINRYLRAVGLDLLKVTPRAVADERDECEGALWVVELVPCPETRTVPQGLHEHRRRQKIRTVQSDKQRAHLARTMMSNVTRHQVQKLMYAMQSDGYGAATVELERSLLRILFNHAKRIWCWSEPLNNPATGLDMPEVDNTRSRVLSNAEWQRLSSALKRSTNPFVTPAVALLLVTAMRVSEPLRAHWADVDFDQCIIWLWSAKGGRRQVPLSPEAVAILRQLKERVGNPDPAERILPITYQALKAAWKRACTRAGLENLHIHDLRHTAATRYALEYHGNIPVLKIITGHKTDVQLHRYINLKASDVVRLMHGRPLNEAEAPAGLTAEKLEVLFREEAPRENNVVDISAKRRAA